MLVWYLAILDNKMSWFTRLKALLRSKNTNPTSLLLSIAFSQLSVRLNKAVSQVAALCVIFQHRAEGFVIDICPAKKRIALEQKSVYADNFTGAKREIISSSEYKSRK